MDIDGVDGIEYVLCSPVLLITVRKLAHSDRNA